MTYLMLALGALGFVLLFLTAFLKLIPLPAAGYILIGMVYVFIVLAVIYGIREYRQENNSHRA